MTDVCSCQHRQSASQRPQSESEKVYNVTAQYDEATTSMPVTPIRSSNTSLDQYSQISHKSQEGEQELDERSYESLDKRSLAEIASRPPAVYIELGSN